MYDCNANRETKIQTKCFGGARKRNKRQIEKWLCHTDIHIWGMSFPHRCADTETVLWSEWLDIKICYSQKTLTLNINLPKFNRQGPAEVPGLCNPSPHRLCEEHCWFSAVRTCVSAQKALRLLPTALSFCLPLIRINNNYAVIFLYPYLMIFSRLWYIMQLQTLKPQWNAGMMSKWLSTHHFQVYICWQPCVWGETPNL